MISVFEHPWLSGLFSDEDAQTLWSADRQLQHMKAFEIALARALGAVDLVPLVQSEAAVAAIDAAKLNVADLADGTGRDGVLVPNLVRQLRASAAGAADTVHKGATSQDVIDTALALTLRDQTALLSARMDVLKKSLADLKKRFGSASMMGRTRMQAASPITVSHRIEGWLHPTQKHLSDLVNHRHKVERVQLGGAVGDGAAFGGKRDAVAAHMGAALGLASDGVWHTDRSGVVNYASQLSLISGALGKMGQDLALMAQQGIDEVGMMGGGGSSAMPHKSNPVLAELLITLARFNATQMSGMHHTLVHEQERSGSAWMLEWMILPSMAITTSRSLSAAIALCEQIEWLGKPD